MPIDRGAVTRWRNAQQAYEHYQLFISAKPDKYALAFADLVFVTNFKGGNAFISEPVATFAPKLQCYEAALRACAADQSFALTLATIPDPDYSRVHNAIIAFATLPEQSTSDISGFGSSFASALLHFYFPLVVPILDKRALNGSGLPGLNVDSNNNVTNLLALYPPLIDNCRERLRQNQQLTLRELDGQLFIEQLRTPPFNKRQTRRIRSSGTLNPA